MEKVVQQTNTNNTTKHMPHYKVLNYKPVLKQFSNRFPLQFT